jgi:hypothetical protein
MIHSHHFLNRAFNSYAIRSGFHKTGIFHDEHGGAYFPDKIMSHCLHWVKLSTWVLQKIPQFNEIFFENGFIPEESFELLHERPNIDNSNQANLNDFVTNRQRCLLIGNNKLEEHQNLRNEINNRRRRRGRQTVCFNPTCMSSQINQGSVWIKCGVARCTKKSCGADLCNQMLKAHEEKNH